MSLSACGDSAPKPAQPGSAAPAAPTAGSGVIKTASGDYRFTPTTCAIGISGGLDDVEVGGAGVGPDGAPIYVEFSSTANALDISLGVDRPFASAENRLIGGRSASRPFDITVSGKVISASGVALNKNNGEPFDANASFEIDCGHA